MLLSTTAEVEIVEPSSSSGWLTTFPSILPLGSSRHSSNMIVVAGDDVGDDDEIEVDDVDGVAATCINWVVSFDLVGVLLLLVGLNSALNVVTGENDVTGTVRSTTTATTTNSCSSCSSRVLLGDVAAILIIADVVVGGGGAVVVNLLGLVVLWSNVWLTVRRVFGGW